MVEELYSIYSPVLANLTVSDNVLMIDIDYGEEYNDSAVFPEFSGINHSFEYVPAFETLGLLFHNYCGFFAVCTVFIFF